MTTSNRIEVMYRLSALYRRDEKLDVFVSYCPFLGIFSQGKTEGESKRALNSAVTMYLRNCHARGILDQQMKKRGATIVGAGEYPGGVPHDADEFIVVKMKDATPFKLDVALDWFVGRQLAEAGMVG